MTEDRWRMTDDRRFQPGRVARCIFRGSFFGDSLIRLLGKWDWLSVICYWRKIQFLQQNPSPARATEYSPGQSEVTRTTPWVRNGPNIKPRGAECVDGNNELEGVLWWLVYWFLVMSFECWVFSWYAPFTPQKSAIWNLCERLMTDDRWRNTGSTSVYNLSSSICNLLTHHSKICNLKSAI